MATKKKMLQAAAGNAGGAGVEPVGVDFDGANDYLQRSFSESTRSSVTFSAWVYAVENSNKRVFFRNGATTAPFEFNVAVQGDGQLEFRLTTGNQSKSAYADNKDFGFNSWNHILCSVDTTTGAGRLYVNDVNASLITSTIAGEDIKPLLNSFQIMKGESGNEAQGRVAHVFVDYTYRNFAVEANRRLFITDDKKPAEGLADLSPIIYLPMDDPDDPGRNDGTGSDFTLNGVVARSGRGPNQYNCVATEFDGSSDYLNRSSITGLSDSKQLTLSFNVNFTGSITARNIDFVDTDSTRTQLQAQFRTTGSFYLLGRDSSGSSVFYVQSPTNYIPSNSVNHFDLSVDTATDTVQLFLNGEDISSDMVSAYVVQSDTVVPFSISDDFTLGDDGSSSSMGEVYFDTAYIDLATSNPFWDDDAGKPKPVRQVLEETGNTPLIAMPLQAGRPFLNLGTGGNFSAIGEPYAGARGASEHIARSVTNGLTALTTSSKDDNILNNANLGGTSSSSWSLVLSCKTSDTTQSGTTSPIRLPGIIVAHGASGVADNNKLIVSTSTSQPSSSTVEKAFFTTNWSTAFVWCDGSNTHINVNGSTTTESFSVSYSPGKCSLLTGPSNNSFDWVGELGFVYFATEAVDFSQESNRLKFLDAFGYPVDIAPAIESGDVPTPLMYMEFKDPSDLGSNSGTGGDFTVIGTVEPSSDVDPS